MKNVKFLLAGMAITMAACSPQKQAEELTLKDVFKDKFLIGTAMNTWQVAGLDTAAQNVVKKHFSAIVAENCMKAEEIHPEKDRYNFAAADSLVAFGEANGITVTGHTLIWHSQCPRWFWFDENGELVSPEVLKEHMREHIHTVVGRYKGRIKGWDVVNEAIVEDGSYRKSPFYRILGEEFIPLAFQYAHEADPDAELYLNDYGMNVPGRRDTYVKIIKDLQERGLRIDAIGMQGHMGMDYPSFEEFEQSLLAYAGTGIKVMITELDMSALPSVNFSANITDTVAFRKSLNPYTEELPDSASQVWNNRMKDIFNLFLKHADKITRVTAWGVTDKDSWKNDFPVKGRTDYPLLFDRNYEPKPFIKEMINQSK